MQNSSNSIVYAHLKPTGEVFYVGKSSTKTQRHLDFKPKRHSTLYNRTVEKYGTPTVQILASGLTEQEAFNFEKLVIKKLREQGVVLANLTDGGEGLCNPSTETRAKLRVVANSRGESYFTKMSKIHKGKAISVETRLKLSKAMTYKSKAMHLAHRISKQTLVPITQLTSEQLTHYIKVGLQDYGIVHGYYCRMHGLPHRPPQPKHLVLKWYEENEDAIVQDQLDLLK
jgi:hypothetical protein